MCLDHSSCAKGPEQSHAEDGDSKWHPLALALALADETSRLRATEVALAVLQQCPHQGRGFSLGSSGARRFAYALAHNIVEIMSILTFTYLCTLTRYTRTHAYAKEVFRFKMVLVIFHFVCTAWVQIISCLLSSKLYFLCAQATLVGWLPLSAL